MAQTVKLYRVHVPYDGVEPILLEQEVNEGPKTYHYISPSGVRTLIDKERMYGGGARWHLDKAAAWTRYIEWQQERIDDAEQVLVDARRLMRLAKEAQKGLESNG